ncbi:MAG: hypothetical protein Q9175_003867, partial [Cornicularia normoerica]
QSKQGRGGVKGFGTKYYRCRKPKQDPEEKEDIMEELRWEGLARRGGGDGIGDCRGRGAEDV